MSGPVLPNGASHTSFAGSFAWQKGWAAKVKAYILEEMIRRHSDVRDPTIEEDTKEATDYVFNIRPMNYRLACRIRTPRYATWHHQVTITCRRETGRECEYHKTILGNWGDYFFYAHATAFDAEAIDADLLPRVLIDLKLAREIIINAVRSGHIRESGPNNDIPGRRCWFYGIPLSMLGPAIIAKHMPTPSIPPKPIIMPPQALNKQQELDLQLGPMFRKSEYI